MISNKIDIRVRYCEVDRMGYLHHGNYAAYFEEGRTELLRQYGLNYRDVEDKGVILPLRNLYIDYFQPAYYDDVVTVETILEKMEGVRLQFKYVATNQDGKKICEATTLLVFADSKTGKPVRTPAFFREKLDPLF